MKEYDMKSKRNYGIDLLRLILMYMVCILHTLGQGGILNSCQTGTTAYRIYWLLEIFSYCAVDGFALISGYMVGAKHHKFDKLVDMWFQAVFYSLAITMILTLAGVNHSWNVLDMIKCALPVTFVKFWYFTAFFCTFLARPVLNKFLFSVDEKIARKAFLLMIVLFSFMGLFQDAFKVQAGYSALWLMVLYCIGVLARRTNIFAQKKTITLIIIWCFCILLTWGLRTFWGIEQLTSYISPTVLVSGLIMVIIFSRIQMRETVIKKLSPLAFGIYLFQRNQVIWDNCIKDAFSFVAEENVVVGILYVFLFASLIFGAGTIVEFVRSRIAVAIKIPVLSRKIVDMVDHILEKTFMVLK